MNLYTLTEDEITVVGKLNSHRKDSLLIICDYGTRGIGIDADALQAPEYYEYLVALGLVNGEGLPCETQDYLICVQHLFRSARVVEITPEDL